MKNINGKELREIVAKNTDAVIIDVRTEDEIRSGMIEGAINYNLTGSSFADDIKVLDKSKTYLMVCRSGNRSGSACGFMEKEGFQNVYNLDGGMMNWDGQTV